MIEEGELEPTRRLSASGLAHRITRSLPSSLIFFRTPQSRGPRKNSFLKEARLDGSTLVLQIENRGVAPFSHDWPVELRYSAPNIRTQQIFPNVKLSTILPGEPTEWRIELGAKATQFQLRIANPMKGGVPLRFANKEQGEEWLQVTF